MTPPTHEAPDLTREELEASLPGRALRTYPAMLSTEAEALAWARRGAPHGAVVVAGYQASPRGRSGLSWSDLMEPGHGLGTSVIVRPDLADYREGWLYTIGLMAAADAVADPEVRLEWPDHAMLGEVTVAAVGVQVEVTGSFLDWGVVTLAVPGAEPPRSQVLARLVAALDVRLAQDTESMLAEYHQRCATLGRTVSARMLPLGPAADTIDGVAEDVSDDGGLAIRTAEGPRVVVLPQALGFLVDPKDDPGGPERLSGR